MKRIRYNFLLKTEDGFRPWRREGGTMAEVLTHLAREYDDRKEYYFVSHIHPLRSFGNFRTFQKCVMKGVFDFFPDEGRHILPLSWKRKMSK